jgi:hypothetical protein
MALSSTQRWLYGGLGAVAPIVAGGITVDGPTLQNFFADTVNMLGFGFRTACLLTIGGFVSFLHKKTDDEWTAFVIGIGAPALIMTLITNGSNGVTNSLGMDGRATSVYAQHFQPLQFIATANAGETPPVRAAGRDSVPFIYPLCMPRRSTAIRFLNGVVGNFARPIDMYWLASAPIGDRQAAVNAYRAYLAPANQRNMTPRIFSVTGGSDERFVLVLNLNLSAQRADASDPRLWPLADRPLTVAPISMNGLLKRLGVSPASLDICHFQNDPPRANS